MTRRDSPATISALSIGAMAWRVAATGCAARVLGLASRGVFLLAPPQRVIFISFERYRSPLTINLPRSFDLLQSLDSGAAAHFSDSRLIFPSIEFTISLSGDAVWQCPLPARTQRSRMDQLQTLRAIGGGVLAQRGAAGLAALLPSLLDLAAGLSLSTEHSALLERLIALRHAVQGSDRSALLTGLMAVLGQGRGLTPSGDDVLIGLLLMLNRWRIEQDWTEMNRAVIETAYQRTTAISANLIDCAASGQGDERLITVVDGIATGSASIDECTECVLSWGSSSGIDALVGMAVAL